jgi:drug/metabolite transporter (DMT)-like permease
VLSHIGKIEQGLWESGRKQIGMNNLMLASSSLAAGSAVAAAFSFALWNIFLQRGLERGASPRQALLTMGFAIAGVALPFVIWSTVQGNLPPVDPRGLAYFAGAGLMSALVAPFHTAHATRRIGAVQTTSLRLLDPFFAFGIGLLFLGEQMAGRAMGGVLLIICALGMLQLGGRQPGTGGWRTGSMTGLLFAVGASFWFTVASVLRKGGLGLLPAPAVSVLIEGMAGIVLMLPAVLPAKHRHELKAVFTAHRLDLWFSGLGAAGGTFLLNIALQSLPVPVAVALRNTSPWFALLLVPAILGSTHRPGRWTWASTLLLTAGMLLIVTR